MSRRTHRLWRRTAAYAALATVLVADAVVVAVAALRDRSAGILSAAVALAYLSAVLLARALSWSWATGRARAAEAAVRRARVPAGRPAMLPEQIAEHRARAAVEEQAYAEMVAKRERFRSSTIAYTAVLPTVITRHEFAAPAGGVVSALPWPWTPPVAEPAGVVTAESRGAEWTA